MIVPAKIVKVNGNVTTEASVTQTRNGNVATIASATNREDLLEKIRFDTFEHVMKSIGKPVASDKAKDLSGRDRKAREGINTSSVYFTAPINRSDSAKIYIDSNMFDVEAMEHLLPQTKWKGFLFTSLINNGIAPSQWRSLNSVFGRELLYTLAHACIGNIVMIRKAKTKKTEFCQYYYQETDSMLITPNLLMSLSYGRMAEYGAALKNVVFFDPKTRTFYDTFGRDYTKRQVACLPKNKIVLDFDEGLPSPLRKNLRAFSKDAQHQQGAFSTFKNVIVRYFAKKAAQETFNTVKSEVKVAFRSMWDWFVSFLESVRDAIITAYGYVMEALQDCYAFIVSCAQMFIHAMCKVGDSIKSVVRTLIEYFDFSKDGYEEDLFYEDTPFAEDSSRQFQQGADEHKEELNCFSSICLFAIQLAGSICGTAGIFAGSPLAVAKFFTSVPLVVRGVDSSVQMAKKVSDAIYYYITGDGLYSDTSLMHEVTEMCKEVGSCLKVIQERPHGVQIPTDVAQRLTCTVHKLKLLQVKMTTEPSMIHQKTALEGMMRMIDSHIQDVVSLLCQGGVRPDPVLVIIHGAPCQGKDDIIRTLPAHVFQVFNAKCLKMGVKNPFEGISVQDSVKTWHCFKEEKYFEGYVGQICVYLSELYTSLDREINAFWSATLQAWSDKTPYMMEMAFGQKGKNPFTSVLIMATTNSKEHMIMCSNEAAYHRRIEFDLNFESIFVPGISTPQTHGTFTYTQDAKNVRNTQRYSMPVVPSCQADIHAEFKYDELVESISELLFTRIITPVTQTCGAFDVLKRDIEEYSRYPLGRDHAVEEDSEVFSSSLDEEEKTWSKLSWRQTSNWPTEVQLQDGSTVVVQHPNDATTTTSVGKQKQQGPGTFTRIVPFENATDYDLKQAKAINKYSWCSHLTYRVSHKKIKVLAKDYTLLKFYDLARYCGEQMGLLGTPLGPRQSMEAAQELGARVYWQQLRWFYKEGNQEYYVGVTAFIEESFNLIMSSSEFSSVKIARFYDIVDRIAMVHSMKIRSGFIETKAFYKKVLDLFGEFISYMVFMDVQYLFKIKNEMLRRFLFKLNFVYEIPSFVYDAILNFENWFAGIYKERKGVDCYNNVCENTKLPGNLARNPDQLYFQYQQGNTTSGLVRDTIRRNVDSLEVAVGIAEKSWSLSAWFAYVFESGEVYDVRMSMIEAVYAQMPKLTTIGFNRPQHSAQRALKSYKKMLEEMDAELDTIKYTSVHLYMKSVVTHEICDVRFYSRKATIAHMRVMSHLLGQGLRCETYPYALQALIDAHVPKATFDMHLNVLCQLIGENGIFAVMKKMFALYTAFCEVNNGEEGVCTFSGLEEVLSSEVKVLRIMMKAIKLHACYDYFLIEDVLDSFMLNFLGYMKLGSNDMTVNTTYYPGFYRHILKNTQVIDLLCDSYGPEAAAIIKRRHTLVLLSGVTVAAICAVAAGAWALTKRFWRTAPSMMQQDGSHSMKKNEKNKNKPQKKSKTAKQVEKHLSRMNEADKSYQQINTIDGVLNAVALNTFNIVAQFPSQINYVSAAYMFRVGGSICAFNKHVWNVLPGKFSVVQTSGTFIMIGVYKNACRVVYEPKGRDLIYVMIPVIPVGKQVLERHAMSRLDFKLGLESTSAGMCFSPELDDSDEWVSAWSVCEGKLIGCNKPRPIYDENDNVASTQYEYYVAILQGTRSGHCGRPYYATFRGPPKLFGIHGAGAENASVTIIPLFSEDWLEIVKALDGKFYQHVATMSFGHRDPEKMYKVRTPQKIDFAVKTQPYSSDIFMRTPFHDDDERPCTKAPAVQSQEAYQNAREKENSTICCLSVHPFVQGVVMNEGVGLMKGFMDPDVEKTLHGCEFLTPEEALDGCTEKGVDSFDFTTADGPRLKKAGIKKEYVREAGPSRSIVITMVMALLTMFLSLGKFTYQLNMDCLKAELRDFARVAAKKTRLFNNTDFIDNILMKIFWGHLVAKLKKVFFSGVGMCGIAPGRQWWRMIYESLKDLKFTIVASDVRAWDLTMNIIFTYVISAWAVQFYTKYATNRFAKQCIAWAAVASIMGMRIAYGVGRLLYRGNTSGNWLTTVLNTIVNYILHKIVYKWLCRKNGEEFSEEQFRSDFIVYLYSDDNMSTCVRSSWWTPKAVAEAFKELYGIDLTNTDKGEVSDDFKTIVDVDFLSRQFRPHEKYPDIICAPLSESSLLSQLYYVRKAPKGLSNYSYMVKQLQINVDNVVRELREYEEIHAKEIYDWIVAVVARQDIRGIVVPDFDFDNLSAQLIHDNL